MRISGVCISNTECGNNNREPTKPRLRVSWFAMQLIPVLIKHPPKHAHPLCYCRIPRQSFAYNYDPFSRHFLIATGSRIYFFLQNFFREIHEKLLPMLRVSNKFPSCFFGGTGRHLIRKLFGVLTFHLSPQPISWLIAALVQVEQCRFEDVRPSPHAIFQLGS